MAANISRNAGEIPAGDKQSLENILGQPISSGERVYIISFDASEPTEQQREQSAQQIESVLDSAKLHASKNGVTSNDIDSAVDEAMEHIRPRPDAHRS
jgi:hypothetical protein